MIRAIRPPSSVGEKALRPCLEFAVFNDGEADAADSQGSVIDADSTFDGSRIKGIGKVAGLGSFNLFYVFNGGGITAIMAGASIRDPAALTPEVGLSHIVVVRYCNRWNVANYLAEISAEF